MTESIAKRAYLPRLSSLIRALMILCLMLWAWPAYAQNFPPLTGRVVDQANILTPDQEVALNTKLQMLETQTRRQLVVATISDLQGYEISDYGYRLGRHWGIGQAAKGDLEKDNGAMLIIAPKERKMRIEVGYGLEGVLTDGLSSQIIRRDIAPLFKTGDYAGGINAGTDRIITQLQLPAEQAEKIAADAAKQTRPSNDGPDIGTIIFWLFIFFFFILPVISPLIFGRGKRGRSYGNGPIIIWGGGSDWGGGGSSWGSGGGGGFGGGFSGGGGSFGGGGASGDW